MKNIIGRFLLVNVLLFTLSTFIPVFAQGVQPTMCDGGNGIETAIGCISADPSGLITKLFSVSLGIAGGIAFLMLILGGLQIQISAGNPERINAGREIIEGAIIGLLLIVFSIFILRVVGVDMIGIPGMK